MKKYFGTDGLRGKVELFSNNFVNKLINSIIDEMKITKDIYHLRFLIGGDTRESTQNIIAECLKIFNKRNIYCINAGVFPTPAISYMTKKYDIDLSICVTASHNPSTDNGIKLFNRNGEKISDEFENAVEYRIDNFNFNKKMDFDLNDLYIKHLIDYDYAFCDLQGLRIGLDCANGATSKIAEKVFTMLGADVITINNDDSYGHKINDNCGSTYINAIRELVLNNKLDIGAAFDGDGDRCLFVDHEGNEIDGDHTIAMIAEHLKNPMIVTTIMANPGLLNYASENNIKTIITNVGDSNVQSKMKTEPLSIGGEQCGHIILPNQRTGDGIMTALYIASLMVKYNKSLKELASVIKKYPQIIKNVPADKNDKLIFKSSEEIKRVVAEYDTMLKYDNGRLNVRESGTQDYIRITMWGSSDELISDLSEKLAGEITSVLTRGEIK